MGKERQVTVVVEQLMRVVLHVSQFVVSYCVILLYMSNNGISLPFPSPFLPLQSLGYIIISILFGALVGFALFTRDTLEPSSTL